MKTLHLISNFAWALAILISCKSSTHFEGGDPGIAEMKLMDVNAPPPASPLPETFATDESMPPVAVGTVENPVVARKIIRDGRMEIRVRELEQGKKEIDSLVEKYKGYYADETFNNQDFAHGYALKIRVPAAGFDAFIAEIESGAGEVAFKNISSRDVTEEYIDLETRLKNKRNYLGRYGDLLKQARSVKDILEIEEKTRLIEEEIESAEGRLKYLNNQIDFSTLDLQISRKNDFNLNQNNKGKFIDRLKLALVKGWFGLVSFALFVIKLWPFWIIAGMLYYLVRRFLKKRKK